MLRRSVSSLGISVGGTLTYSLFFVGPLCGSLLAMLTLRFALLYSFALWFGSILSDPLAGLMFALTFLFSWLYSMSL